MQNFSDPHSSSPSSNVFLEEIDPNYTNFIIHDVKEPVMEGGNGMTPDLLGELESLNLTNHSIGEEYDEEPHHSNSFLLMDGKEKLRISNDQFIKKLTCSPESKIKVVSIFGNTGDGKSHTMNHTFFGGEEVFRTSSEQRSCTLGVWAAYQPSLNTLCLDTEGLLGVTPNENQRTRMLLKVLAISDIIIYRTRSERLHSDMFTFLGTASKAFVKHFAQALQSLGLPEPPQALGPAVVIFHETRNTKILESSVEKSAEEILRERFAQMSLTLEAFSSIKYVGIQTNNQKTDYTSLINAIKSEIENTTVRSPRQPGVIFQAIKALNLKFSGEIKDQPMNVFPEQYFTCGAECESCGGRCERSMGHVATGEPHRLAKICRYQHQYENKVLMCKQCYTNGIEQIVHVQTVTSNESTWLGLAKYAWSGSLIECPNCGEIYRSRKHWYGNKSPEDAAVRYEMIHVWKGSKYHAKGPNYSAQLVLDGVSFITETVQSVSAQPTKSIKSWVADTVAPKYWRPNSEITNCCVCKDNFEEFNLRIHHCRACGDGVCNACSKHQMSVPLKGWDTPVRVCNNCREEMLRLRAPTAALSTTVSSVNSNGGGASDENDVLVRKYGEAVINTLSTVASVLEYPKDFIKDSARPSYWVPDSEASNCKLCEMRFGTAEELDKNSQVNGRSSPHKGMDRKRHHCRSCGQAVCNSCSLHRRPVPERGWTIDVRVCDSCIMVTE
ncbi:zinc finger FYVE domain-containing protein 1-like [Culicoides brevitarsis]|uniref:zinc finger FYVE domain-containing protein 1-like n=1 Tax=Culicoides brevitarsis TaxID=469753 RepID=UPI00307C46B9